MKIIYIINHTNHFTGYFNGFMYRKQVKHLRKALLSCSICVIYFCCDICVTYFIFLGTLCANLAPGDRN